MERGPKAKKSEKHWIVPVNPSVKGLSGACTGVPVSFSRLEPRRNLRLALTGSLPLIACGVVGSALGLCLISVTYLPRILGTLFDLSSCICETGSVLSSLRTVVKGTRGR